MMPAGELMKLIESGSVAEIHAAIASRQVSVESITAACLDRIRRVDSQTCAIIAVNPDALAHARRLDGELASSRDLPSLYGIPVLVKDNIETHELPTTAGSLALVENHTGRDAPVVAALRRSGAIILGKTNLSEWANFRSRRSSSGWSGVGGQTRNPHDLSRSPCGSSSGSAVSVAAGLAPLAIGTETDGSIVCPAHVNGIVGIKPTVGLLPQTGIVPISHSQDTAGPMARDVESAARLLSALQGGADFTSHLANARLEGKRLGVVRSATGYHEGVDRVFDVALDTLRSAGAILVDDLSLKPGYRGFRHDAFNILLYEFKHDLNRYLQELPNHCGNLDLAQLIEFNRAQADVEMTWFEQELFVAAQAKGGLDSPEYKEALARAGNATRADGIDRLLTEHALDALIAPTGGPAWRIDLINGDHTLGGFSGYPAVAGYPHVTLPMGEVHGLPVGLSLAGAAHRDREITGLAYAYEQARGIRPKLPAAIASD